MSYETKLGGCLRIEGYLLIKVLDVELGCYYTPLANKITEIQTDQRNRVQSLFRFNNVPGDVIVHEMREWSLKQQPRGDRFPEEPLLEKPDEIEEM